MYSKSLEFEGMDIPCWKHFMLQATFKNTLIEHPTTIKDVTKMQKFN